MKTIVHLSTYLTLIICFGGVLSGCTTAQHIRKDDYYRYDWGLSGAVNDQLPDAILHHPIFTDVETSLEGPANYHREIDYFVFGLYPDEPRIKMSEACGSKPFRQAYLDHSLWQATLAVLTLGIYTPRTIQIWCGNETARK